MRRCIRRRAMPIALLDVVGVVAHQVALRVAGQLRRTSRAAFCRQITDGADRARLLLDSPAVVDRSAPKNDMRVVTVLTAIFALQIAKATGWRCDKGKDLVCGNHTIPHKDITKAYKKAKDADVLSCTEYGCAYPKQCRAWTIKRQKKHRHHEARGEVIVFGAKYGEEKKKYSVCMAVLEGGVACRCAE